jgi:hypothetical protein
MLIAVGSLKGSPGATTVGLGMAACLPESVDGLFVEADPAGGALMARFGLEREPSLLTLAAAARSGATAELVEQHVQRLPGGLPVVVSPPDPEQVRAALTVGRDWAALLRTWTIEPTDRGRVRVVVWDCGRLDPGSAALPIVRSADAMVLLARPCDDQLAHLAARLPVVSGWSRMPCLVLVGAGHSPAAVHEVLGSEVMGHAPHDPRGAALLGGRSRSTAGPGSTPFGRAAAVRVRRAVLHARTARLRLTDAPPPEPSDTGDARSLVGRVNGVRR